MIQINILLQILGATFSVVPNIRCNLNVPKNPSNSIVLSNPNVPNNPSVPIVLSNPNAWNQQLTSTGPDQILTSTGGFMSSGSLAGIGGLPGGFPGVPACSNEYKPFCAQSTRVENSKNVEETFDTECAMQERDRLSIYDFRKLRDGKCDCNPCNDDLQPICQMFYNGPNRAFRNRCYYERYICLHGTMSVSATTVNEGYCRVCEKQETNPSLYRDAKGLAYLEHNIIWQNREKNCKNSINS